MRPYFPYFPFVRLRTDAREGLAYIEFICIQPTAGESSSTGCQGWEKPIERTGQECSISASERGSSFKAPWDWHELQIEDGDPCPGKAVPGETLTIEQHFGRKLELARFYQYPTHGGSLSGFPQARDSTVEEAVRTARDMFGGGDETVALLRPRLKRLPPSPRHWPASPPARLPLVATIAVFDSKPAGDDETFRSSAVVIWFQERFGLPVDRHVIMQLQDLDWPAHARDWDR